MEAILLRHIILADSNCSMKPPPINSDGKKLKNIRTQSTSLTFWEKNWRFYVPPISFISSLILWLWNQWNPSKLLTTVGSQVSKLLSPCEKRFTKALLPVLESPISKSFTSFCSARPVFCLRSSGLGLSARFTKGMEMSSCGPPLGENCLLDSPIINRLGDARGDTRRISLSVEMRTVCC